MARSRWLVLGWMMATLILATSASVLAGELFSDARLGYSIEVPTEWTASCPDAYTVRFSGPDGVYVKAQNIASAALGGTYADVGSLAANIRCQLALGAESICIYAGGPFDIYDTDGVHLAATQFLVEYTCNGAAVREWVAVVGHNSGDIFYVLSYTAASDTYPIYEPAVVAMVRTWVVSGASTSGSATPEPTSPTGAVDIVVILQDRGHIGPYDYVQDAYDKRLYDFTVSAAGYVALCVVDQVGEAITGWIFAADGTEVTRKPGNCADVYTSAYSVLSGTYTVKVGQDHMATESDFEIYVYFSLSPFTIDDLVVRFGPRIRVLP